MEQHKIDKLLEANPRIDRDEMQRCEQAVSQLADAGIKLGGYRLQRAFSGKGITSNYTQQKRTQP